MSNNYTKLIASIAHRYKRPGIEVDDLIQEGYLGLMEAENRYDKESNTKFTTYATFWIKKFILEFIQKEYKQDTMPYQLRYKLVDLGEVEDTEAEYTKLFDNILQLKHEDLTIILLRFGLGASDTSTYDKIGTYFGKSREWARKRVANILEELRDE